MSCCLAACPQLPFWTTSGKIPGPSKVSWLSWVHLSQQRAWCHQGLLTSKGLNLSHLHSQMIGFSKTGDSLWDLILFASSQIRAAVTLSTGWFLYSIIQKLLYPPKNSGSLHLKCSYWMIQSTQNELSLRLGYILNLWVHKDILKLSVLLYVKHSLLAALYYVTLSSAEIENRFI